MIVICIATTSDENRLLACLMNSDGNCTMCGDEITLFECDFPHVENFIKLLQNVIDILPDNESVHVRNATCASFLEKGFIGANPLPALFFNYMKMFFAGRIVIFSL